MNTSSRTDAQGLSTHPKVLGIVGSLREDSYNRKLMLNAVELFPKEVHVEIWDGLKDVPPYDADDDQDLVPHGARAIREAIAKADGILIATPEYNLSIPGVLKNAIDWASRPFPANSLSNKPVAVVGASTSRLGTMWAQQELKRVLGAAGARALSEGLAVPLASSAFDTEGRLIDGDHRKQLASVVGALLNEINYSLVRQPAAA